MRKTLKTSKELMFTRKYLRIPSELSPVEWDYINKALICATPENSC